MNARPSGNDLPPSYTAQYQRLLDEATAALTAAARLRRPVLEQTDEGQWIESPTGETEQTDWAEFVTLALAGATANFGGLDAILQGRSGSWEAGGVRQLLMSTVGEDGANLWSHRTDPLEITLYVDELLSEHSRAHAPYDAALAEIDQRRAAVPEPDIDEYVWWYDRTDAGEYVARSPEAPAWSLDRFRDQPLRPGDSGAVGDYVVQDLLLSSASAAYLFRTPAAAEEVWRLEDLYDAQVEVFGRLEEDLERQRVAEWSTYGAALKERVEAAAAAIDGLMVPVRVLVDVDTFRSPHERSGESPWNSLEGRLVVAAVTDTPTPADLPGTPLSRLGS